MYRPSKKIEVGREVDSMCRPKANNNSRINSTNMFDFGFNPFMSAEALRSVYRKNLIQYHPDKIQSREKRVATDVEVEEFRKMQNAYNECLKHVNTSSAPEPPKPAPEPHKSAPEPPKPAPEPQKSAPEPPKPKSRCCGVCGLPGHTRVTCPLVNPKKAAQRVRTQNKKNQQKTQVPKTTPPPPPPTPNGEGIFAETATVSYSIKFNVPTGLQAGSVIKVPYMIPTPTGMEKKIHNFTIKAHQLKYKQLYITIPI